jgi:hypothetical protein
MLARRRILSRVAAILTCALALVPAAHAAAPPPLSNPAYGFPLPGDFVTPATAASAGLSLADRWLGQSPYENPAAKMVQGVELSPVFQRVSRQDLASKNRDVVQNTGYLDLAGLSLSLPIRSWGLVLYGWQPVLRLEEQSYSAGPLVSPAQIRQLATQREVRGGAAVSHDLRAVRLGVAGEWVHRDDSYETHEQSGSPSAGDRVLQFNGDAWGGSAGITWSKDPDSTWGSWVGAALHYTSDIAVTGTSESHLLNLDTTLVVAATHQAEWSGGVSTRVTVAPSTRVVGAISLRTGYDWQGFDFGTSGGTGWSLGLDWKDPELPWGARFGVGQESNPGAVEPKAGLVSAGFTWVSGDLVIDVGLMHRNLRREGSPNSADDRAVASVKLAF